MEIMMTGPARTRRRPFLVALLAITFMCGAGASAQASDDAEALADKMLEHLGGRAEWAALRNTASRRAGATFKEISARGDAVYRIERSVDSIRLVGMQGQRRS